MLHCREVTKRFGEFAAVDGVSFDLAGGICALLGPNVLPKDLSVFDALTIEEHPELGGPVYGLTRKKRRERSHGMRMIRGGRIVFHSAAAEDLPWLRSSLS